MDDEYRMPTSQFAYGFIFGTFFGAAAALIIVILTNMLLT